MKIDELFRRAEHRGIDASFTRINDTHPVGLFLGLEGGRRCVLAVISRRPLELPRIGALHIDVRPRASGEWALTIRLERADLSPLFTRLVEDLVASTLRSPTEPGTTIIDRLIRWQRMMARGPSALLDDLELRGLVAEIAFLVEEALPELGPNAAITAWVGPYDAPKDFVFVNCEVEVKATTRQPRTLRINSLEQLTDTGLPLYLWTRVVELDNAQPHTSNSVASWVRKAREAFAPYAEASDALEDCLRAGGWEDREEYEARIIHVGPSLCYRVHGSFPRIQRSSVATGVTNARYRIDVATLTPFVEAGWQGAPDGR